MRKINNHKAPIKIREGIDYDKFNNDIHDYADNAARLIMNHEPEQFNLTFHWLAVLVDMTLDVLGYDSLADFNPKDLDKLPERLRELTIKAEKWRHLPTCETEDEAYKDCANEYGLLWQSFYNDEIQPLIREGLA